MQERLKLFVLPAWTSVKDFLLDKKRFGNGFSCKCFIFVL